MECIDFGRRSESSHIGLSPPPLSSYWFAGLNGGSRLCESLTTALTSLRPCSDRPLSSRRLELVVSPSPSSIMA
eukprot:6571234-Pyramimonas_sp.AAC.1